MGENNLKNNEVIMKMLEGKIDMTKDVVFIENRDFVEMMNKLKENTELVAELGFMADYSDEIESVINNKLNLSSDKNIVINNDKAINLFESNKEILEFFKYLDTISLCMVVEPNGNFYLDVDFAKLKQVLLKNISAEAIKALCIHESVQEFAVVDTNGELMADKINEFREKILIDCDFEKNPVLFAYSCQAMDELNLGIKLHSRLK